MDRAAKAEALSQLKTVFADAGIIVVTGYSGMSVSELSDLREQLKSQGGRLQVVKNRLARMALSGRGGDKAAELFRGPVAVAWSSDPIIAPKIATKFAKKQKLKLIGALMDDAVLDNEQLKRLAALPSLDELRGKLIGLIQAPSRSVVSVVSAPGAQLARLLAAHSSSE